MMSSCFGSRRKSGRPEDRQPLLPQYEDDTSLQRAAHQKMHSYQMLRALTKGYMPSTEQVIVNLRTLLASDFLNPETPGLSESGRKLMKFTKLWLTQFIELLRNKNDGDQIQDFVWFLLHSRVSVNTHDLMQAAQSTRARADASAGTLTHTCQDLKRLMYCSIRKYEDSWKSSPNKFRFSPFLV